MNDGSGKVAGSSGRGKGVITRDFERLDDEFLLHEVSIGSDHENGFASAGNQIVVNREFGFNANDGFRHKGLA